MKKIESMLFSGKENHLAKSDSLEQRAPTLDAESDYAAIAKLSWSYFHPSFVMLGAGDVQDVAVLVLNRAKGAGKSMVSANLLYPNLCYRIYSIDPEGVGANAFNAHASVNAAHAIGGLIQRINRSIIQPLLDISSASQQTLEKYCAEHPDSIKKFDFIVVPVTPGEDVESATIQTLKWLDLMKVDPTRVRIVFNKVPDIENVAGSFPTLISHLAANPQYTNISMRCALPHNPAFAHHRPPLSVCEMLFDEVDYRAKLDEALARKADEQIVEHLSRRHQLQQEVREVAKHLEAAYLALNMPIRRACFFSRHVNKSSETGPDTTADLS